MFRGETYINYCYYVNYTIGNSELVISCRRVGLHAVSQKPRANNYTMFSGFSIETLRMTQIKYQRFK